MRDKTTVMQLKRPQDFADDFIKIYLQNGFGIMNKSELEILIFHLLRRDDFCNQKSIFGISRELHIPEAKVRKLIYEADLRYGDISDAYVKKEFFACLSKAHFQTTGNKIEFPLDDKLVRSAIDDKLRSMGYFSDTSHNRDVFSIHIDAFVVLIDVYYTDANKAEVLKKCKSSVKGGQDITFKGVLKEFLYGASRKAGEIAASAVFGALSGGLTEISPLITLIKNVLK